MNAERYYKELGLGNPNEKPMVLMADKKEEKENLVEEFDKDSMAEVSLKEEVEDRVEEEEIITEETSSFFYHVENKQKFISGALPLLEEGDDLKKFISECIDTNACENSVTFLDNGETLSWKSLMLSVIGLFDKIGVENAKISIEKKRITLEGAFDTQEAKNHLSSLLAEYKLNYKIDDMTTIAKKEKPLFTIIKDDVKIEKTEEEKEEITEVQEKISQLLKEKQIHFEKGSGKITAEGKKVLDELVKALDEPDTILLEIQGHTDAGGRKRTNLNLSKRRADAVKKYLIKKGLKSENMTAKGFGESKLLLPKTPYNILNRRVEIYLKRR
jgi:outer membrane protein OmpA-like peptidoglycan-associated protein